LPKSEGERTNLTLGKVGEHRLYLRIGEAHIDLLAELVHNLGSVLLRAPMSNLNAITPETETGQAHDCDIRNRATTDMLVEHIRTVFRQDVAVLEPQQCT
jgi:hypothetical protein